MPQSMAMNRENDAPRVSVIIPTYCEAANVREVVRKVCSALKGRWLFEIIIVDDDSPDGTAGICHNINADAPLIVICRKNKRGLGTAVLEGMDRARGELFVVMDADLSHPPEAIPSLLDALTNDDVAVSLGSRYVVGGTIDSSWLLRRRLLSRFATLVVRPLTTACDPMTGFFAVRREFIANARPLTPVGFKIALEILAQCTDRQFVEVPIHFAERLGGESKLSISELWRNVRHLASLYTRRFLGPS